MPLTEHSAVHKAAPGTSQFTLRFLGAGRRKSACGCCKANHRPDSLRTDQVFTNYLRTTPVGFALRG